LGIRRPAALIRLCEEETKTLQNWSRRGKSEHRLVERARIILLASEGRSNEQIA
jgi:Txe/YoeB family toxin of Txe-Axe toxin-antitoxin module